MSVENALYRHLQRGIQKHKEESDGHRRDEDQTHNERADHAPAYLPLDEIGSFLFSTVCSLGHIK